MNEHDRKWFDDRPVRTEPCIRCSGHGKIVRSYALAPADYVHDSPNDAIRAMVIGCFDIFTACREASEISLRSGEPVAFRFNGHTVVIHPDSDPEFAAREWWTRQHGETPEQTRERR